MKQEIKTALISRFFEGNKLLAYTARKEYRLGSRLKAAAFTLYTLPLRKLLTPENIFITAPKEYYHELHRLLHIAKPEGVELVRIGRDYDGGYIMPDDFARDDKIAYSFGISSDVSFDKGMASRGYDVFMYDHTIDGLPEENPRFHWSQTGLSDGHSNDERLKTLDELIAINHHEDRQNMILKMDVEGYEWGFFENVSTQTLSNFSVIAMELHWLNEPRYQPVIPEALRKLNQTHQIVHIHGQNTGSYITLGTHTFCNQIEITCVRRDRYTLIDDYDVELPISIDMPALARLPEVPLGHWNREIRPDDKFTSLTVPL